MKKYSSLILLVLLLALVGFLAWPKDKTETLPVPEAEEEIVKEPETKKYTSANYGFSFEYPIEYDLREYTASYLSVGNKTGDSFQSGVNIVLAESIPDPEAVATFEEFVLDQARLTCAAEGQGVSYYCLEVKNINYFESKSGIEGETFFLTLEKKNIETGKVEKVLRGPFFAFNTSEKTPNAISALIIYPPLAETSVMLSPATIEAIAKTVHF